VRPLRDEFTAAAPFPLDRFQLDAIDAIDAGHHRTDRERQDRRR
jgi:superfamily II RNA helicase